MHCASRKSVPAKKILKIFLYAFHPYFYWPKCPSAYKLEVVDKIAEESYNFGEIVNNENT